MSSEPAVRFVTFEHDHTKRQPIPEIGDIWPRVERIISAQTGINNREDMFREQQLTIARDRCLSMASPFAEATDTCIESFFCRDRFFYRFSADEEYFWITAVPEQLIAALYFPLRKLAVGLYPSALDPVLISEFERLRAGVTKPDRTAPRAQRTTALVAGFPQFMHMLWNHLPALELAVSAGLAEHLPLAMIHEPFGPTAEIFPEFAGRVTRIAPSAMPDLNRQHALLVGLGSRTITTSLQARIRRVAKQHSRTTTLANRERFRAAHAPIFWMTVKPPDRTAHNQTEALAIIIDEIKRSCPDAGFLLDGASLPWDFADNSSYDGFFREYLNDQVHMTEQLISELVGRINAKWRPSVVPLAGISACDEIVWAGIADFYFCHGGTPHHKIGWMHDTPGMIYSNSKFVTYYKWLKPLERHPPVYYLPASLVADDPDANYGPDKLARKDQNFTLLSPAEIAQRLLASYRESQQLPKQQHAAGSTGAISEMTGADTLQRDKAAIGKAAIGTQKGQTAPSGGAAVPATPVPASDPPARGAEADSLQLLGNGTLDPLFWPSARPSVPSAWYGHVPFAHWIVTSVRPMTIVELGTHYGASYSAFCEAVLRSRLKARCFAVDTWEGDQHTGYYENGVFDEFKQFNDARYGRFSTLLRARFDEAAERFADHSVDLLHLDGMHTYEAVKHDFETWLPKMANSGIVLLHDIMVREREFGVYKLWDELRARYPSFAFTQCHGLGAVAVGSLVPPAFEALSKLPDLHVRRLRARFESLGASHELRAVRGVSVPPDEPLLFASATHRPIDVVAMPQTDAPIEALADIWDRLGPLLRHVRHFNKNEMAVREQQHGIIRDGCFSMPSPFTDEADTSSESYYFPHRFCYRFEAKEEYFWITAALDKTFELATVYFPERRIAIILYPGTISEQELLELEKLRAEGSKPDPNAVPCHGERMVVTGYSHYMHTLWNELPALEHATSAGLGKHIKVAAVYSPFGPIAELFPELADKVRPLVHDQIQAINGENRLLVGLGSWTITRATQERVRAVAVRHTDRAVLWERDQFRASHYPVFWFSVKSPRRTCLRQVEVLARMITAARQSYPSAGFLLNGTSLPWDLESNPNYGSWFSEGLMPASAFAEQTIAEVISQLPPAMRSSVRAVSGVSVCEEIAWGAAASFYFCHGGTMQNKIGWIHRIPGMVHSPSQLMPVWAHQARVVEDGPPCYLVSRHLIADCEPESYTAFGIQRSDADYYFTSVDDLIREFLETYRTSTG